MLTENNGIVNQVQEAKTKTEKSSLIEQVRIDILEKEVEKQEENIDSTELQTILIAKEEYGGYEIKLSDIYNGEISSSKIIHFTVNGEEYETKENVTWEEFLNEQECQGLSKESHYGYIGKNFKFMGGANRRNRRIHLFRR